VYGFRGFGVTGTRGPISKPDAQRRRRNKPPAQRELPPLPPESAAPAPAAAAAKPKKAAIPQLGLGRQTLKSTHDWWKTVWASPMAGAWIASDVPALRRLASLLEASARGDTRASLLSEIRQLEDRFGLSPMARLRLQWKPVEEKPAQKPIEAAAKTGEARFLRAVQ
jgi:hypothetical protein